MAMWCGAVVGRCGNRACRAGVWCGKHVGCVYDEMCCLRGWVSACAGCGFYGKFGYAAFYNKV
jgi:hypothetical protein